jgi:hypothetical protein
MTQTDSAAVPKQRRRGRTVAWILLALVVIAAIAALQTYLTAPRPGEPMDAESTSPDGAHALVTLLRDHGVDVVAAGTVDDVEHAARLDSLIVVSQTHNLSRAELQRVADAPGDRLVVAPTSVARERLAPGIKRANGTSFAEQPDCDLREANRAGVVQFGLSDTYNPADDVDATRCYDGALIRLTDRGQTVTVVGSMEFMTNSGLLREGNAALAMNLAGSRPRVIWYAPEQPPPDESDGTATIFDLIPERVDWIVWQLCLAVVLFAVWKARRVGPLVAERLPVVVRASEAVEGRGRLYRSRRARDSAATALRAATLQRLRPRLGLAPNADASTVVEAVAARCNGMPEAMRHTLFGPTPSSDNDLVNLAHQLDDIERQVAQS